MNRVIKTIFVLSLSWAVGAWAGADDDLCAKSLLSRPFAQYVQNMKGNPLRETLIWGVSQFDNQDVSERTAVDLGVGAGTEVIALVKRGFRVLAIDKYEAPLEFMLSLIEQLPADQKGRVRSIRSGIVELGPLNPPVDLFHAAFTLHYVPSEKFPATWKSIEDSIKSGGIFAGNFLGQRDTWSVDIRTWTSEQLRTLFTEFTILKMQETEFNGMAGSGEYKYWHILSVVAKKR